MEALALHLILKTMKKEAAPVLPFPLLFPSHKPVMFVFTIAAAKQIPQPRQRPFSVYILPRALRSIHTFSAFWLRSSVVSVLISVKTDNRSIVFGHFHINI